ncbi:hypothetical protein DFH06DRAFT_90784 [Mycena polygramma]|nr:hypothetical protein DFH06DRAFT_90784 [Mycena polygramma]
MTPSKRARTQSHRDQSLGAVDTPCNRAGLDTVSFDIQYSIFVHLHPLDLLRLSRTSKGLRRILLSRGLSRQIWRACLKRSSPGLPACPEDFPEPLVSSLLFAGFCTNCSKKAPANIDWDLRVRLCSRCGMKSICAFKENNPPQLVPGEAQVRIQDVILTRPPAYGCAYLTAEFLPMKVLFANLGDEERTKFTAKRKALMVDAHIHARQCREWEIDAARKQEEVNAVIRAAREKAIRAKLFSLGWGDELAAMGSDSKLSHHPLVTKPEPLTEIGWIAISSKMDALMKTVRQGLAARKAAALRKEAKKRFAAGQRMHGRQWGA